MNSSNKKEFVSLDDRALKLVPNGDAEELPFAEEAVLCNRCGFPAPVSECDVADVYSHAGYKAFRVRIVAKCGVKSCEDFGKPKIYRKRWSVMKKGKYVEGIGYTELMWGDKTNEQ